MCEKRDVFLVGAARTPIGSFLGSLKDFTAPELGGFAIKEALKRANLKPEDVEEVIMGNVVSAGVGQTPAGQAAVKGGIPYNVSCFTVNKVCGSALKAVALAAQAIQLEEKDIIVAGGMESMSRAPHLAWGLREGVKFGDVTIKDSMILDGLWCAFDNIHMGLTGEVIAEKFGATREEQDRYAAASHERAVHAIDNGYFKDEIVPVAVPQRKGDPIVFAVDEGPRRDAHRRQAGQAAAGLQKGRDGHRRQRLVAQRRRRRGRRGLDGRDQEQRAVAAAGPDPRLDDARRRALDGHVRPQGSDRKAPGQRRLEDGGRRPLRDQRGLLVPACRPDQGARARPGQGQRPRRRRGAGHPIGATGARILTTLVYALKHRGLKKGIASLCLGGGDAVAMAVELV